MVVVRHNPSGLELCERPAATESVGDVKSRLIAQIEAKFYPSEDFQLNHYSCARDGVRGGAWEVIHLPTAFGAAPTLLMIRPPKPKRRWCACSAQSSPNSGRGGCCNVDRIGPLADGARARTGLLSGIVWGQVE